MRFSLKVLFVLSLVFVLSTGVMAYERSETLVVSGAAWNPPSTWNPFLRNTEAPGNGGLVYEFLFSFDPLKNEFTPWLAKSGEWITDNEYLINLREGIKWTDGEDFNAEDVAFTFEIAKDNPIYYASLWDWLDSIDIVDSHTLKFTFNQPQYADWDLTLYQTRIIPEHIWSKVPEDELITVANENPVGTGPYMAEAVAQDRMVWVRNEDWWGNEVFGKPKPKYIVDLVNTSNNVAIGMLMKGELDLVNNFLPGIHRIKDTLGLNTWYKDEPYMLSWNTAMLYLNCKRKPMDDAKFRRALAFAINKDTIVDKVYGGVVKAANSAGLFTDAWLEYYDEDVEEEHGFYYDPDKAKEMLDTAGYVDADGDGWRDLPNGDPIELTVIVPSGWTDWMESIKVIAKNAQEVGINLKPDFPDFGVMFSRVQNGDFDMHILNFNTTLSSSPFTYWNAVANSDIDGEVRNNGNWGQYNNPELFAKIDEFNTLQPDNPRTQELASEIQKTLMVEMPSIPVWHNGLWCQTTSNHWTNWPNEDDPYGIPITWRNAYQLGMIDVLINIEPVK